MKNRIKLIINNEEGSLIVITLLILTLLTLIGTGSLRNSRTESMTATNDVIFKQNLYQGESAAVENASAIETATRTQLMSVASFDWLNASGTLFDDIDISNPLNWTDSYSEQGSIAYAQMPAGATETNTRFLAIEEGKVEGGSLDMSTSQVYSYSLYGRSNMNNGLSIIHLGYRKAY